MRYNKTPTCPYCGYELDDDELWYTPHWIHKDGIYTGDGDVTEKLICPQLDCKKEFNVVCSHLVRFAACDEDGEELLEGVEE